MAAAAIGWFFTLPMQANALWTESQKFVGTSGQDESFGGPTFDTDTLFISANNPSQAGEVSVYNNVGETWTLSDTLTPSTSAVGDRFGISAAIDGSRAAVGQLSPASAWIFEESGGTWGEAAQLVNPGSGSNQFGLSVDLGGITAVVGARREGTGAAYVFEESSGSWSNTQTLFPAGGGTASQFGRNVYYDGIDTIAVSDIREDDPGDPNPDDRTGAVHIYKNLSGTWTWIQRIPGTGPLSDFGNGLAGDGDLIVIGAPGSDGGAAKGRAYVYERQQPMGTFALLQELVPSSPDPLPNYFEFGFDVAVDGDLIVVGSSFNDPFPPCSEEMGCIGKVHVFENQSGTFNEVDVLTGSDSIASDLYGANVAISGGTIAVSAHYWNDQGISWLNDDTGTAPLQGAAYIYERVAEPDADFDQDGDVDGDDFLTWQRGHGIQAPNATRDDGDADGDQAVDGTDLGIWQSQFGSTTALPAQSAVPEPSSLLLLALAVLGPRWFFRVRHFI